MPFTTILTSAERLLSRKFGRDVRFGDVVRLSDEGRRNLLLRCHSLHGSSPATVIIKKVVVDTYNPEDVASWDTRRFFSDWAGAEFLSGALDTPRTPRFYGGDYSNGFFILEDLGDQRSLVEPLLEEDAAGAERALLSFSACLGSLHAATIGRFGAFEDLLRTISPQVGTIGRTVTDLGKGSGQLQTCLDGLAVHPGIAFAQEVEAIVAAMENPGPFLSYIHGDACPDNTSWDGEELRVIDFEFGGFGHALIDATYGRMMFPTCWCANALPGDLVSRMEAVYRTELAKRCPEAQENRIFDAALANACGFWLLSTLGRSLAPALEADRTWGIATMRQRLVARLDAFITTAEEGNHLPALRDVASRLRDALRKAWPEAPPLPLYPAFQRTSLSDVHI
jgi:hypothetical protein